MFTPQRKAWSGWLSPRSEPSRKKGFASDDSNRHRSPTEGEAASKGKGVALVESTPRGLLGRNDGAMDSEVVIDKISKLENELYEYQYNMGLLLIEKKEWTSNCETLQKALDEAKEALKREQMAHLLGISEVEKREENLRKALGVEKQCVLELEKALREMRVEHAEVKFNSDSKLAEANALFASIEEKALEVKAKMRADEAKLAEVNRRTSEVERIANEVEAGEGSLRRERASFTAEKKAHEHSLSTQREDLRGWERKLQAEEARLAEIRRLLNEREERANENDKTFKQRQADLVDAQKRIETADSDLKRKEDDISRRIGNLPIQEKEADVKRIRLEMKERELLQLEEKLSAREQVEIQKVVDEHKTILDAKKHEFELEMEQKKKTVDDEFETKVAEVEKNETEVRHMEEKVAKREQALETKLEKLKEKEKDLDLKSKALKEKEKALKAEENSLESEKKQTHLDKENLNNDKAELEKLSADIEERRLKINEERQQLQITEEERSEYARVQLELKHEIEKWRLQGELLSKEKEDLKHERERFEKEWEELDERRTEIAKELESVNEEKKKLENSKHLEEERLNNQRLKTREYVERESEALKLAKDSFAALMEHEKSAMAEKLQNEKSRMDDDFESRKRELETELQNKEADMENHLLQREKLFEEQRERELINFNTLREVAAREREEMKLERVKLEKERQDISENQKHLEGQRLEIRKDIDELVGLSKKLKEQREEFFKERERFVAFVDKHKGCQNCGERTSEFVLSDLHSLAEMKAAETFSLPRLADEYLKDQGTSNTPHGENPLRVVNSVSPPARTMSWLRKCTSKMFIFSPSKKNQLEATENSRGPGPLQENLVNMEDLPRNVLSAQGEQQLSVEIAADSFDVHRIQFESSTRDVEAGLDFSANEQSNINNEAPDADKGTQYSNVNKGTQKPKRGGTRQANRARSTKAVLGTDETEYANGALESPAYTNEESRGESNLFGKGTSKNGRKRSRSHTSRKEDDPDYSEGHSDSVNTGSRRKRRQQVVQPVQAPPGNRYNLRRHKTAALVAVNGDLSCGNDGKEKVVSGYGAREGITESIAQPAPTTRVTGDDDAIDFSGRGVKMAADSQHHEADTADKLADEEILSEEVNGTLGMVSEHEIENENIYELGGEQEDDDNDDDGDSDDGAEVVHPGEGSIGRKVWTFIST